MTKKQAGFSLHLVIAVVVGVALIGVIVWRVMDANSSDESQSNNTTSNEQVEEVIEEQNQTTEQQEVVDPNEGYVVIEEWGVRFKPVDGLVGVEYGRIENFADAMTFTVKELSELEPNCSVSTGKIVSGGLARFNKNTERDPSYGGTVAEIGDYRYQYRYTGSVCSKNSDNESLESKSFMDISQSVKSLEAAK